MPLELLLQAGLTPTQAEILGFLLSQDQQKAKDIVSALKKPRGVVYKGLDELVELRLVEKIEKPGQIARFRAEHPSKLEALFEAKEKAAQMERQKFLASLPDLTSQFNLAHNKPGVRFYEGREGFMKTLEDTLTSKTEVLLILNREAMAAEKDFARINADYTAKREKAGVKKRIIRIGRKPLYESSLGEDYEQLTQIRYLEKEATPFTSSIQIYDKKISYQMMSGDQFMGVIVEDKNIYEMNRFFFDALWQISN